MSFYAILKCRVSDSSKLTITCFHLFEYGFKVEGQHQHPELQTHGDRRWELDQGATLYDVTHLACRSARYTPATVGGACSPANAKQTAFPVAPGGTMPPVEGYTKQDYAVIIVIGMGLDD